ncbi:MAG: hypothetical protein ACYC2Y_08065 [Armatimonadota bacterium]
MKGNLVFDKSLRGHLPVSRFAVSDAGEVTLVVPDEYAVRTYRLVRFSEEGSESLFEFSVKKPTLAELTADGRVLVAATADDMYVFRGGEKNRFFSDRRENYTAISLSTSGEVFAVGATDMIVSSHAVTLAGTVGESGWTTNLRYSITDLSIAPDGSRILIGCGEGIAVMLDARRKLVWEVPGDGAITAVETTGELSILATEGGMVYALDAAGERLWHAEGDKVAALAVGGGVVAAARVAEGLGSVELYSTAGERVFEYDAGCEVLSIACSPSGNYLAASCRDGALLVFSVAAEAGDAVQTLMDEALAAEPEEAAGKLAELLRIAPGHVEACEKLVALREKMLAGLDGSLPDLVKAHALRPYDWGIFERLVSAREAEISRLFAEAEALREKREYAEALSRIQEIIGLDPESVRARAEYAKAAEELAQDLAARAEAAGPEEAVELLAQAVAVRRTPEFTARLTQARSEAAFAEGMNLYRTKEYAGAVRLFKKALSLWPEHPEAGKYIEYADNLRGDDALFDRFSKLE